MKGPWKRLLNIAERVDGTPCEDLADCPDVLIDLNCWLMDHEELSARAADAAPELLYACRILVRRIMQDVNATGADTPSEVITAQAAIAKATEER